MKILLPLCVLSLSLWSAGCEPEFDPYNELAGLRVLAVRAEPAELSEGESTTLDALIYEQDGKAVARKWSFCPWTADPNDGYTCPVDQATFDRAFRNADIKGAAPSLELGKGDTANLPFPADLEGTRRLCEQLARLLENSATIAPDCSARWEWTVHLTVTSAGRTIDTIKDVTLLLTEEARPNRNPMLTGLLAKAEGDEESVALDGTQAAQLRADREHGLRVVLDPDSIETFMPVPVPGQRPPSATEEALTFTWFAEAGTTDRIRSTYRKGVETLTRATENDWQAPSKQRSVRLYVVARDHRGGIDWREGLVRLID